MYKQKIQLVYTPKQGVWTIEDRFEYSDEELDIIIKAATESKRRNERDRRKSGVVKPDSTPKASIEIEPIRDIFAFDDTPNNFYGM